MRNHVKCQQKLNLQAENRRNVWRLQVSISMIPLLITLLLLTNKQIKPNCISSESNLYQTINFIRSQYFQSDNNLYGFRRAAWCYLWKTNLELSWKRLIRKQINLATDEQTFCFSFSSDMFSKNKNASKLLKWKNDLCYYCWWSIVMCNKCFEFNLSAHELLLINQNWLNIFLDTCFLKKNISCLISTL